MSGKLMTLVESFGYKDDKKVGLESTDEIRWKLLDGLKMLMNLKSGLVSRVGNKTEEVVRNAIVCDDTALIPSHPSN